MSRLKIVILSCLVLLITTVPISLQADVKVAMERVPLDSPKDMSIYEIIVMKASPDKLRGIIKAEGLTLVEKEANQIIMFQEKSPIKTEPNVTRMSLDLKRGHMYMLPNLMQLSKVKVALPSQDDTFKYAQDFFEKQKLIQDDGSQVSPKKMVVLSKADIDQNKQIVSTDILQSVHFQRLLDNKPVMGTGSQLSVDLSENGKVVGFNRVWNLVKKSNLKSEFLSEKEVYNSIESYVGKRFSSASQVEIKNVKLVYYGNDQKYIQPAYFYTAIISTPQVEQKSYFAGVVSALKKPPETIMPLPDYSKLDKPAALKAPAIREDALTPKASPNDPTVGRYVVRDDSWDWVDDACGFKNGLNFGHPSGYPAITFGDYYWDYPYLWTTSENSYVDKWNISLMEGHGNSWLFTTRSNCCDIVNLNASTQPGYGNRVGNSMRFLILKGCSIIPAPPDRSNWDDPWWRIFKGLRQAVGFRTEMYIDDDISFHFAYHLAQNCRVLDSWFHATNSCFSYQWERFWGSWGDEIYGYGAVVMIPGHEGDGIYSTGALSPATSTGLTIWWQH